MAKSVYRNSEGYYDPTAGAAIAKITRTERRKARHKAKRQDELKKSASVYTNKKDDGDTRESI